MYNVEWGVLADNVIRDADRNTVSIIDLIEAVIATNFPVLIPRVTTLWLITREAADPNEEMFEMALRLNGQDLNRFPIAVTFDGKLRARCIVGVNNIVLQAAGNLEATLFLGGQALATRRVVVLLNTAAPALSVAGPSG
jgi:hypothetical protein